ncbi:MAG: hypothetical protein U0Y82_02705 [Thermoleophilia bacterium]
MNKDRALTVAAVIAALAFLVIGIVYFADTASSLPSWMPGHEAGSSHHHVKHGIAAVVVALGLAVLAWFRTGRSEAGAAG